MRLTDGEEIRLEELERWLGEVVMLGRGRRTRTRMRQRRGLNREFWTEPEE
jgi:hypothetical protein